MTVPQQQETRPYVRCFLLGCCDHSTRSSQMEGGSKKVREVSTWLNKGPKVYCESVFAVGCKHMCWLLDLILHLYQTWLTWLLRNSFVCLEWVQQEARGDFSLAFEDLCSQLGIMWPGTNQCTTIHWKPSRRKKNSIYKNQEQEPIHQKYKANDSRSRNNPTKKQK